MNPNEKEQKTQENTQATQAAETAAAAVPAESWGFALLKVVVVALLFAVTYCGMVLTIAMGNIMNFACSLHDIGVCALYLFFSIFVLVSLVMLPFTFFRRIFPVVCALFVTLGIFMYIQGNWFLWKFETSGMMLPNDNDMPGHALFELIFYVIAIVLAVWCYRWIYKYAVKISLILIVLHCLSVGSSYMSCEESFSGKKVVPNFAKQTEIPMSSQENVLVILVDTMGNQYFQDIKAQFPGEMESKFKDFYYYPHFLSPHPYTSIAVPSFLAGQDISLGRQIKYNSSRLYLNVLNEVYSQGNAFAWLSQAGYQNYVTTCYAQVLSNLHAPIENEQGSTKENIQMMKRGVQVKLFLCTDKISQLACWRLVPLYLKWKTYDVSDKMANYAYSHFFTFRDLTSTDNTQALLANEAEESSQDQLMNDKQLLAETKFKETDKRTFWFIHLLGPHHKGLFSQNYVHSKYVLDAKAYMDMVADLLDALKASGQYDNTCIVIFGDHGQKWRSIKDGVNPALLIKKKNQTFETMQEKDDVVFMWDVMPTVLMDLGVKTPIQRSMWNFTPEEKAERQEQWEQLFVNGSDQPM